MEIFENLQDIGGIEPTAIALGNFDGVHLGHQRLIGDTVEKAREKGLKSAVFTFSNQSEGFAAERKKGKEHFD